MINICIDEKDIIINPSKTNLFNKLSDCIQFLKVISPTIKHNFAYCCEEGVLIKNLSLYENFELNQLENSKYFKMLENIVGDLHLPPSKLSAEHIKIASLFMAFAKEAHYLFLLEPLKGLSSDLKKTINDCIASISHDTVTRIIITTSDLNYWSDVGTKVLIREDDYTFSLSPILKNVTELPTKLSIDEDEEKQDSIDLPLSA